MAKSATSESAVARVCVGDRGQSESDKNEYSSSSPREDVTYVSGRQRTHAEGERVVFFFFADNMHRLCKVVVIAGLVTQGIRVCLLFNARPASIFYFDKGCTRFMHSRGGMIMGLRIPTIPGRFSTPNDPQRSSTPNGL